MPSTLALSIRDGCEQVALLPAGLDSRAFRLGLAETLRCSSLTRLLS
jgi:O-methyltransferase involved in polyketide biosynthesis